MPSEKPADPRLLWGFWLLAAAVTLVFLFCLRLDLRSVRTLDPAQYTETPPAGFRYDCQVLPGSGVVTFQGWAAVTGEELATVDCRLVLYSAGQDRYYLLPTTMEQSQAAADATGDAGAVYAGLYAFALTRQLPAGELELCFAYRNNHHNALIHTGQITGGAA